MSELISPFSAKEPNPAQVAAASVAGYLDRIHQINKIAVKVRANPELRLGSLVQTRRGLEDAYAAYSDTTKREKFVRQWGEQGEVFLGVVETQAPTSSEITARAMERASKIGTLEQAKITAVALKKIIFDLSAEQREQLFKESGYTGQELVTTMKRIGISTGLSTGAGVATYSALGAAEAFTSTHHLFSQLPRPWNDIALGVSWAAQYGTNVIAQGIPNMRALEDENVGISPNIWATYAYYLTRKIFPEKIGVQRAAVIFTTFLTAAYQEPGFIATLFTSHGRDIVTTRNIVGAGVNIIQGGATYGWWRKHRTEKN